jgi:DNA-binding PadR family transcriptional regulator
VATRNRSNPLALSVLVCLLERPMHPYEVATTLRQRGKHESVKLNYGSLYSVVESLERRGLIEAQETQRAGRLPERTVYRLTDPGRVEVGDWLAEMLSVPVKEYPAFEAALSFLPAVPPDEALTLLRERALRLEVAVAQAYAGREVVEKMGLPRIFWVETEYATRAKELELEYVRALVDQIASGTLEGTAWWRRAHETDGPLDASEVLDWPAGPHPDRPDPSNQVPSDHTSEE